MSKKPLVVITRKLPDSIETRMRELFEARLNVDDRRLTKAELIEAVSHANVLVPTITDHISEEIINAAGPNLKLIANFGNGTDNIDVVAAAKRGITVTNTPNVLTEDTADMTMALMLAAPRRLVEGASILLDDGKWEGWGPTWMLGRRIWGKRLGIVGMGRIGTRCGAPRQGVRPVDPLSQPQAGEPEDRRGTGGDLLGKPRSDAGAHGHHFGQLPLDARDLPSALRPAPRPDAADGLHRQYGARPDHR